MGCEPTSQGWRRWGEANGLHPDVPQGSGSAVIDVVPAETHSAEYLLHKYWSRKPHNVIRESLRTLLPDGGRLLDPFCGSGVVVSEAARVGIAAHGVDVNPA